MPNTEPKDDVNLTIEEFTAIIDNPDTPAERKAGAIGLRGSAYLQLSPPQLDKAIEDLTTFLGLPDTPAAARAEALIGRAIAYGLLDPPETEKQLADFNSIIGMSAVTKEQKCVTLVTRGLAYSELDPPELEKAMEDFTTVINMSDAPADAKAISLVNRALFYEELDPPAPEKGAADYTAVIDMSDAPPEQRALALVNRGSMYGNRKPPETMKAMEDFNAVVQMPDAPTGQKAMALVNRGIAYQNLDTPEPEKAVADFTASIGMHDVPVAEKARALVNRGAAYVNIKPPETKKILGDFAAVINMQDIPHAPVREIGWAISALYQVCAQKDHELAIAIVLSELQLYENAIGQHRPEFLWMLEKLLEIKLTSKDISDESLAECFRSMQHLYGEVSKMEWDTLKDKKKPAVFHHYTKSEVFRLLVPLPDAASKSDGGKKKPESNFLRLGNMEYVNDGHEGLALQEYCRRCKTCTNRVWEKLTDADGLDNSISSKMFVLCFAGDANQLDHWRMYGHNGAGVSIGIPEGVFKAPPTHHHGEYVSSPLPDLQKSAEPEGHALWTPMSVMYTDDEKKEACNVLCKPLQDALDLREKLPKSAQRVFRAAITGLLLRVLYRFKDEAYLSEGEWRTFVFVPDLANAKIDENEYPHRVYLETERVLFEKPGYEVWIGPKVEDARKVRLEFEYRLACKKQAGNVDLNISKHHYR